MPNSEWVTLQILWKEVSLHLFLWPTASEWLCKFCERQCIFSYDQQQVSDKIAHFVKGSLVTSFLQPTVSQWQWLHILLKAVSSHLFQLVSDIAQFVKGNLITYFPLTNRGWVTLYNLSKAVSSHLFLPPTGCEWHCTICERNSHHIFSLITGGEWHCTIYQRQSHHIFSYHQQDVSDMAHFVKGSLITSFLMTNREWVTLQIMWKAVSLHPFPFH